MGNFRRDNNDNRGGGRSFARRDFNRSDSGPRTMFKAVCSNCGKDCEVPFKPTTGKPVYCSDCFEKVGGRSADSERLERSDRFERTERPRFERPNTSQVGSNNAQLEAISAKLDKIISLLTPKIESDIPLPVAEDVAVPVMIEKTKSAIKPKAPKVKRVTKKIIAASDN